MNMGDFPSGQRGQTVNLLAKPSVVRIHHLPPNKRDLLRQVFFVWWNEAFPYGNIKQPLAMKTLTLMKCGFILNLKMGTLIVLLNYFLLLFFADCCIITIDSSFVPSCR